MSSNYNCYRSVDFSGNSNIRNSDHHRRPRGCPALSLSCISSGQPSQLTLLTNLKLIRNYINQLLSFVPTKFNSSGAQLQLGGQEIEEQLLEHYFKRDGYNIFICQTWEYL